MEQIQTFLSPPFLTPARRKVWGAAWAGTSRALLLPIPVVGVVFVTLVAWLEP